MVRKNKWIEDSYPQEPVQAAAHRALRGRLKFVWYYLVLSAEGPQSELENVHQLRVATRRAMAAMQTFECLLPRRRAAWMNKQLKRIRRAAGDARDLDVLAARWEALVQERPDGPYAQLLKRAGCERDKAQEPLRKIHDKLIRKGFRRRRRALLKRVGLRSKSDKLLGPTLLDAACKSLRTMVNDLFIAARKDLSDDALLHAFRIQTKYLRYAMELFSGAFGPQLRQELYPHIAALQEQLGQINDHVTAQQHLADWLERTHELAEVQTLEEMIARERAALAESRLRFLMYWSAERSNDLQRRFHEFLTDAGCA